MSRKKLIQLLMTLLLVLLCSTAAAQEAQDITRSCLITREGKRFASREMTDRRYSTYCKVGKERSLVVDAKGKEISGIFLQYYDRATPVEIQAEVGDSWQTVAEGGTYLSEWYALPAGTTRAKIINTSKSRLFLAELTVYGAGERPARAASWHTLTKTDMMVMVGHPDDELLWFGGLLPTYAGEKGLDVQVVYAVKSTPVRRLELLDGLWTCGVTAYPDFLDMPDARAKTLAKQYQRWGKDKFFSRVTEALRKYKPDVVVTHDFSGEYGHGAHRAVADALTHCVEKAADETKYVASAEKYGAWQVKKLYVHLYGKNELRLDWHQPLNRFDGEDGMSVAKRALACHASQTAHGWAIEEGGRTDNTRFGLFFSAVGEDTEKNDLMEHIVANWREEQEEEAAEEL